MIGSSPNVSVVAFSLTDKTVPSTFAVTIKSAQLLCDRLLFVIGFVLVQLLSFVLVI